jgi:DNA polymerase III delta prime subunit
MSRELFISEALHRPVPAIAYDVSRTLATLYPEKAIIEGNNYYFSPTTYAQAGHCTLIPKSGIYPQLVTYCNGNNVHYNPQNVWYEISWQSHTLEVLWMNWGDRGCSAHYWILASSRAIAESFLLAVHNWCTEIRSEILVFDGGSWYKSEELFQEIKSATFDNLVMPGSLKQEIRNDLKQFFASQALYETYGIPWKRGILFVGPPGNGKTHAVKALINELGKPCLYVKSLDIPGHSNHTGIRAIFARARESTPCILVLEDLDSLITPHNRSFFLNELDGFAVNRGIVTLATTNYPERLDPAILNRPSRFDRKYHFELPGLTERVAYITLWNKSLQEALRLDDTEIVQLAEAVADFSYAYIKELFLSAMMRWINQPQPGTMATIMMAQTETLREQMSSVTEEPTPESHSDASFPWQLIQSANQMPWNFGEGY